jgi:hypothetical protein
MLVVMQVVIVRVAMRQRRLAGRILGAVAAAVMDVVAVAVLVGQWCVVVEMLMLLGEMKKEPHRHQRRGDEEARRRRLAEPRHRQHRRLDTKSYPLIVRRLIVSEERA